MIYQTWSAPRQIWSVPAAGGTPRLLSASADGEGYADVSPDGRWIAFTRAEAAGEHVYVAPIAAAHASGAGSAVMGPARLLRKAPGSVPRWSPDGQQIAFSPDRGYADGVLVIDADGTRERRVAAQGGWPVWWPDGRRIGYLVQAPDGTQEIQVVPARGSAAVHLAGVRYRSTNHPFDVSRDGKWLVTSNTLHQSDEIWLRRR